MHFLNLCLAALFGLVQGITEWLPISNTGHMILLNQFLKLDVSPAFWDLFLVVVQFGSIMAVVVLYWSKLFPFTFDHGIHPDKEKWQLWGKILIASVPAGIVGLLWDDVFTSLFYNYVSVAIMLILFGIAFLVIEQINRGKTPRVNDTAGITCRAAFLIGLFQLIAGVFPGTSRSGATIVGALLLGISRPAAAEFTFFLAVPVMLGGRRCQIAQTRKRNHRK